MDGRADRGVRQEGVAARRVKIGRFSATESQVIDQNANEPPPAPGREERC